jgi:hypothetical protein
LRFHILVPSVEHDIPEDGAHHPTLRDTALGGIARPILYIPRFEKATNPPEKAMIREAFTAAVQQHGMIDAVVAGTELPCNTPLRRPAMLHDVS